MWAAQCGCWHVGADGGWQCCGGVVALSVYTGFTLLWGLTYYAETFEEQAGVTARPVTVDELEATTRLFMEKLNAAAPLAPHAAPGVLSGDTQAMF